MIKKFLKILIISLVSIVGLYLIVKFTIIPNFSWFSSNITRDEYTKSYMQEVEAAGYNIRSYTFIDGGGRLCTKANDGVGTGLDCDFIPDNKIEEINKKLNLKGKI